MRQENRQPRRLLCFSAAFFLSAALFSLLFPQTEDLWDGILLAGSVVFGVVFACLAILGERALAWRAALIGLAAGWIWTAGYAALVWLPSQRWVGTSGTLRVELTEPARGRTGYGEAWGVLTQVNDRTCRHKVRVYLTDGSPEGEPGDVLTLDGSIRTARRDSRAGMLSRGVFLTVRQEGACAREAGAAMTPLRALRALAGKLAETAESLFPGETGTLFVSMLLGARGNVSAELERLLTVSGTRHITAVSGLHVSILSGALLALFGKKRGLVLAIPAAVLYGAMVGFPASVVRACVMLAFCGAAFWLRAESDGLTSLGAALLLLMASCPFASVSAGLLLSFAASLGMIVLAPALNAALLRPLSGCKIPGLRVLLRYTARTAGTSLAALLFTFPLTLLFFDSVPLLGLPVNILVLWAVSWSMVLGMGTLLLALIWPAGGGFLARWVVRWPLEWILLVIRTAGKLPFASTGSANLALAAGGSILLVIALLWRRKQLSSGKTAAIALAVCLAASLWTAGERMLLGELRIINSGGAPVLLLRGSSAAAINCGARPDEGGEALDAALRAWSAGELDSLICTGSGYRSQGGLPAMAARAPIGRVILPAGAEEAAALPAGQTVRTFRDSGTVTAGGASVELIRAGEGSFACRVLCGDLSLTDLSGLRPEEALRTVGETALRAELLLIGDALAGERALLCRVCAQVQPRLILVCGSGWRDYESDCFGIPMTQVGWEGVRIRFMR